MQEQPSSTPIPPQDTQNKNRLKKFFTALATIIVVMLVTVGTKMVVNHQISNNKDDPSSFLESEEATPYVSAEHGFTIGFPGFPSVEHSTLDVEGVQVPYTQYVKEINNGKTAYMVQIAKYPKAEINTVGQERGSLDGALNGMAQNSGATIVSSSNNGTFLGYPSAEAHLTYTEGETTHDMYARNFIKDNSLYTVITIGEIKSAFKDFADSLTFQE